MTCLPQVHACKYVVPECFGRLGKFQGIRPYWGSLVPVDNGDKVGVVKVVVIHSWKMWNDNSTNSFQRKVSGKREWAFNMVGWKIILWQYGSRFSCEDRQWWLQLWTNETWLCLKLAVKLSNHSCGTAFTRVKGNEFCTKVTEGTKLGSMQHDGVLWVERLSVLCVKL